MSCEQTQWVTAGNVFIACIGVGGQGGGGGDVLCTSPFTFGSTTPTVTFGSK